MRITIVGLMMAAMIYGQGRFTMKEVVEFGPLQRRGGRIEVASAGVRVEVRQGKRDFVRIAGKDVAGTPWSMESELGGMVGQPELWVGDLDGNGRTDLVLVNFDNRNGRCVDGASVTVLLIGLDGMPMPWRGATHYGYDHSEHASKAMVRDRDGNGRAEVVQVTCEYGEQMSEIRKITSVYEAREGRMMLVREFPASVLRGMERGAQLTPAREWVDPITDSGGGGEAALAEDGEWGGWVLRNLHRCGPRDATGCAA